MSQDKPTQDFNITQLANAVREMRRMAAEVRHLIELGATDPNIDGAAQRAHVLLPLATDALGELALAFMASDDVEGELEAPETPRPKSYLTDEEFAAKHHTTLDSPADLKALADGPTLGEYVARCREVLPRNFTAKSGYAMWCLENGVSLDHMSAAHARLAMGPAKKKARK